MCYGMIMMVVVYALAAVAVVAIIIACLIASEWISGAIEMRDVVLRTLYPKGLPWGGISSIDVRREIYRLQSIEESYQKMWREKEVK